MKKFLALFLVLCLIVSFMPGVLAQETDSIADLIISLKEKIGISDDEYEFETYYVNTYNDITTYSFSWKKKTENSDYIRIEAREEGTIVNFYKTNINNYSSKFLKYSKDSAKSIAMDFLEKINAPKEVLAPEVQKFGSNYSITFKRVHEGIEVSGDHINCTVSGETGEVVGYSLYWTYGLEFGEINYISFEKAQEIYKNELGYDLFYTVKTEESNTSAGLVYKPKFDEKAYIEALSGQVKTYAQISTTAEDSARMEASVAGAGNKNGLSEKELKILGELKGVISIEEAMIKAKKTEEFEIDESYTLESSNTYKKADGKFVVTIFMVSKNGDKTAGYKNISYDGETGKLLDYSSYSSNFEEEEKDNIISNEEGRKIAENFLKKTFSDEFLQAVPTNRLNNIEGNYEYKRTINNIKVSNNGFSASVDLKTGRITRISRNITDCSFPSAENVSSLSEVYQKLLTKENLKTKFLVVPKENNKENVAVLVYDLENTPTYDAKTLVEVSPLSLEPTPKKEKPEYTDISGHYAEERIRRLVEEDIYLEGTELIPEKAITYKEFASLVYMTLSGSEPRPLNELYKSAEGYLDIDISEEKKESPIKRVDAVKLLLDNMGYKEFAAIKGIFNCPFTDIDENDKGYLAIAAGLKIVSTADTCFYKEANLKRCDAFIIIYNYMAR